MVKRFPAMDAWMREAAEAARLIDDLEIRIKNRSPDLLHGLKDSAKPKLLELGVKLDRLESLLHNPPSKPILTEADVDSRWELLSDIQLRTRVVALTLFAACSTDRHGGLQSAADIKETQRSASIHNQVADTAASSSSDDDPELLRPLVLVDATPSRTQINDRGSAVLRTWLWKACWVVFGILGASALLLALVVLCAII